VPYRGHPIRAYDEHDAEDVLGVRYRASIVTHSFLPEGFFERERDELVDRWLPASETFVYEVDGRLVGFLSLIDNEAGAIFVDPEFHRGGVGRALMDDARRWRSHLELSVFEANEIGRRFYEAYGFRAIERRINVDTGLPELRLRLG
jgi:putative acetyltransferase